MEVDGELDEVAEALQKRPLRTPVPELHHPVTDDGVPLQLTRFHGGDRGPVILAPGFGVSTLSFTTLGTATSPLLTFSVTFDPSLTIFPSAGSELMTVPAGWSDETSLLPA